MSLPFCLSTVWLIHVAHQSRSSRSGALPLVCPRPLGRHHPSKLFPSTQSPARSLASLPLAWSGDRRARSSRSHNRLVSQPPAPPSSRDLAPPAPRFRAPPSLPVGARLLAALGALSDAFPSSARRPTAPGLPSSQSPECSASRLLPADSLSPSRRRRLGLLCRPPVLRSSSSFSLTSGRRSSPSGFPLEVSRLPPIWSRPRGFRRVSVRSPTFSFPKCRSRGSLGLALLRRLRGFRVCRPFLAQSCSFSSDSLSGLGPATLTSLPPATFSGCCPTTLAGLWRASLPHFERRASGPCPLGLGSLPPAASLPLRAGLHADWIRTPLPFGSGALASSVRTPFPRGWGLVLSVGVPLPCG